MRVTYLACFHALAQNTGPQSNILGREKEEEISLPTIFTRPGLPKRRWRSDPAGWSQTIFVISLPKHFRPEIRRIYEGGPSPRKFSLSLTPLRPQDIIFEANKSQIFVGQTRKEWFSGRDNKETERATFLDPPSEQISEDFEDMH